MSGESWPEYLVLEMLRGSKYKLDIRRDEVIDEAHNYCAENGLIDDGNITPPTQAVTVSLLNLIQKVQIAVMICYSVRLSALPA